MARMKSATADTRALCEPFQSLSSSQTHAARVVIQAASRLFPASSCHQRRTQVVVCEPCGLLVVQLLLVSAGTDDTAGDVWSLPDVGGTVAAVRAPLDLISQIEPRKRRRTTVQIMRAEQARGEDAGEGAWSSTHSADCRAGTESRHTFTRSVLFGWHAAGQ